MGELLERLSVNFDVFFDNLQVVHKPGPLIEETHYYPFGLTMQGISSVSVKTLENKRKWNSGSEIQSKEFTDGSGLELYATNYRQLDPQLGRWWQQDPKPDYSKSIYMSMDNNPFRFIDPMGDTPTVKEAAYIADHVYGPDENGKYPELIGGWRQVNLSISGVVYEDPSGYNAGLYSRTNSDGKVEYVFATRGSEMKLNDWKNNLQQAVGNSEQYAVNARNAKALIDHFGKNTDLTFVGHSLGGGLAAGNGMVTNRPTFTFNAAGLSPFTKAVISETVIDFAKSLVSPMTRNIDAYVVKGEILNYLQKPFGLGADGNVHKIGVGWLSGYKWDPTGATRHMMGAVKTALNNEGIK